MGYGIQVCSNLVILLKAYLRHPLAFVFMFKVVSFCNYIHFMDNLSVVYSITSMASTPSRIIIVNAKNVFLYTCVFGVELLAKGMKVGTCLSGRLGYLKPGDNLIRCFPPGYCFMCAEATTPSTQAQKMLYKLFPFHLVYIIN